MDIQLTVDVFDAKVISYENRKLAPRIVASRHPQDILIWVCVADPVNPAEIRKAHGCLEYKGIMRYYSEIANSDDIVSALLHILTIGLQQVKKPYRVCVISQYPLGLVQFLQEPQQGKNTEEYYAIFRMLQEKGCKLTEIGYDTVNIQKHIAESEPTGYLRAKYEIKSRKECRDESQCMAYGYWQFLTEVMPILEHNQIPQELVKRIMSLRPRMTEKTR